MGNSCTVGPLSMVLSPGNKVKLQAHTFSADGTTNNDAAKSHYRCVDLLLPKEKLPLDFKRRGRKATVKEHFQQSPGDKKSYAIGSSVDEELMYKTELGLFEGVKEAWEKHYNLRTTPEDWWFPVARRIAKAIDKAAKSESYSGHNNGKVRELFVNHEGKEEIKIDVPDYDIYSIAYDRLFERFSTEIRKRIKVPAFADRMQNDFSSTTTPTHKISSEINLMASVQEFFTYEVGMCGCGLKGLEMAGSQEDWDRLVHKLREVEKILEPIIIAGGSLGHLGDWFRHVEMVYSKLAESYANDPRGNQNLKKFWADVLMHGTDIEYGPSGFGETPVAAYNGWLVKFLTGGNEFLRKKELNSKETREVLGGLNGVPAKLTLEYRRPQIISDQAELIGGIGGFVLYPPDETFNRVPSVRPHHVWALMLDKGSPLREPYHRG